MFEKWCDENFLELNTSKTKEMITDFRSVKQNPLLPMTMRGETIEFVASFKYLGTIIDNKLSWIDHCQNVYAKAQQRLYFLRKMYSFHVDRTILLLFYKSVIESVILSSCIVWFGACRKEDAEKLKRIPRHAKKMINEESNLNKTCASMILKQAENIIENANHPLHSCYTVMRSGKRFRSVGFRTNRFGNSFIPLSIRELNKLK